MRQAVFRYEDQSFSKKIEHSLELLREHAAHGSLIAYSGGKDSDVIDRLSILAGLNLERVYHVTTVDPPELVRHVRERGAFFDHPGHNYFNEIAKRGLPTRWRRWCCRMFKHGRTIAEVTVLGVRAAESARRRQSWAAIQKTPRGILLCPILNWSDSDVWRFIEENKIKVCSLYNEGFKRIGCVGCPLARGSRIRDFQRWPKYGRLIHEAFNRYVSGRDKIEAERFWEDWIHDRHGERKEPQDTCTRFLDLWS